MSLEQKRALLHAIPTFALLDSASLRAVAEKAVAVELAAGQVLFQAGDASDGGYVIASGGLELMPDRPGQDGRRVGPGALVGELALLVDTPRPATARAVEETSLLHIPRQAFLHVLEGAPQSAERMRRSVAERLDGLLDGLDKVRDGLENFRPTSRQR